MSPGTRKLKRVFRREISDMGFKTWIWGFIADPQRTRANPEQAYAAQLWADRKGIF